MNPLIVSYDAKRDLWIVLDGKGRSVMSDGALMSELDSYRNRVLSHADKAPLFDRMRKAWDNLNRIKRVYISDTEGLVLVDKEGNQWGRHGLINDGQKARS